VDAATLRSALVELARECGIAVRVLQGGAPGVTSGAARVKGAPGVVLAAEDPPSVQIDALAGALVRFARTAVDARYLPPAVRAALDRATARETD
jgi:hypothetical protein